MENDDELGPLLVAPPPYFELRRLIRSALGFPNDRKPLLIGIDGTDGSGKSSVASWLSWQLEMPAVHLDLYLVRDSEPLTWRYDDLSRVFDAQTALQRPVIVEGVPLLRVLQKIGRVPDFLVFVEKDEHEGNLRDEFESYFATEQPETQAAFVLKWSSAEHDARMMQANYRRRQLDRRPLGTAREMPPYVQVESRMSAVAWGLWPTLRFPSPLIEPDVPISGIRLSDWFHRKAHGEK